MRAALSARPGAAAFDAWIFDLDNTLYSAACDLFAQTDLRMGAFIVRTLGVHAARAERIRDVAYRRYGSTLVGLMRWHGIEPTAFLDFVHDIDLAPVVAAPALRRAIERLPGRKFIYTNASRAHAERVADRLGVLDAFDTVFDISACGYLPKPQAAAYRFFLDAHGISAGSAIMFDDLPKNLVAPHALGMRTVLVHHGCADTPARIGERPAHVDHITDDLVAFLNRLVPQPAHRTVTA